MVGVQPSQQYLSNKLSQTVFFADLGEQSYQTTWNLQEVMLQETVAIKKKNKELDMHRKTENFFLYVSHPNVYTLGKSGKIDHLLLNEIELEKRGIAFFKTNRGGDITYHGPGQVIGYPIFDLEKFFTDIHKYLRFLEEAIIETLAHFDIKGNRSKDETGVWIDAGTPFARKICAMGVRCSRWVSMHGFALNVNTDLGYFDNIIPCGIRGKGVTSMALELKKEVCEQTVKDLIREKMTTLFDIHWQEDMGRFALKMATV